MYNGLRIALNAIITFDVCVYVPLQIRAIADAVAYFILFTTYCRPRAQNNLSHPEYFMHTEI